MLGRNPMEPQGWRGHSVAMCGHRRLVDEERGAGGQRTGQLICLECGGSLPVAEARTIERTEHDETTQTCPPDLEVLP
jgi:hypothetical protein